MKPNPEKKSGRFDGEDVLLQLQYSGTMETIRIRQQVQYAARAMATTAVEFVAVRWGGRCFGWRVRGAGCGAPMLSYRYACRFHVVVNFTVAFAISALPLHLSCVVP